jgi:hypothetical protein
MENLDTFKDFNQKKRKKTRIRKIADVPYQYVPTSNPQSPAPAAPIYIKKVDI